MLALAICLPFLTCASPPAPEDITKVVVSHSRCEQHCVAGQLTFWSDGRFEVGGDYPENDVRGKRPVSEFRTMAQSLVQLPAFGRQWDFTTSLNGPITYFWIEAGKRVWQVRFPTALEPPFEGGDVGKLQNYDRFVSMMGTSDRYQALLPSIMRARNYQALQTVVFTSNGCYGRCPAYVATFQRSGAASLDRPMFLAKVHRPHSVATVSFDRVIAALRLGDVATMRRHYGVHTVDTYGVSLHLQYRGGFALTIQAPDDTSWDVQLASIAGALSQLVNDTDWR